MQEKDVNSKVIFDDPLLCSQFLRDNLDIPLLKNVQPEDIEDVTAQYQTFIGSDYRADSVKKVRIREMEGRKSSGKADEEEMDALYLISLIDHKSGVDYDVTMQLLKYMVCIWSQYAKDMDSIKRNTSKTKDFQYPPILPIVYYEGTEHWTAGVRLQERIMMNQIFGEYMPDFTYRMVRIQDYSNEDLLSRADEMSFLMMLNKIQNAEELNDFVAAKSEVMDQIIRRAPERIIQIFADTIGSLCRRLNVPEKETEQCVEKVRSRQMGYLFENMEKMDIQEERRKTKEAQEKLETAQKKAQEQLEATKQAEMEKKQAQRTIIELCQEYGGTKQDAISKLVENCNMKKEEAEKSISTYWK